MYPSEQYPLNDPLSTQPATPAANAADAASVAAQQAADAASAHAQNAANATSNAAQNAGQHVSDAAQYAANAAQNAATATQNAAQSAATATQNAASQAASTLGSVAQSASSTAQGVAQNASASAQQVAQGANQVVGQVQQGAGHLAAQVQQTTQAQLAAQKVQAAGALGGIAQTVRQVGDQMRQSGQAPLAQYADGAAHQIEQTSHYLNNSSVEQLVGDLERFARRQPAIFIAGGLLVGLAAARFLRSTTQHENP